MKLQDLDIIVTAPPAPGWGGRYWILVKLVTDDGVTGWGECYAAAVGPKAMRAVIEDVFARHMQGENPENIELMFRRAYSSGFTQRPDPTVIGAFSGLEIACWDILGKALGCPVTDLLGGAVRDNIEVMGFVQNGEPDVMRTRAAEMVAAGYGTLYTKVGFGTAKDVAAATALREGGGEGVELRVDPNEAWAPGVALDMAQRLAPLRLQYIEQPIRAVGVSEMAMLRQRSPVPIAANQSSWVNENVVDLIRANAADVIMTDPWQAGGIQRFADAAAICDHAGIPLVYHSFAPLSIATRAAMAVLTTTTAITYAHQTYNHMTVGDVLSNPVEIVNGRIALWDDPGLGCHLDRDLLAERHDDYLRDGYLSPYGTPNRF